MILCHGLPGSRLLSDRDPLRAPGRGLRVLAVDRPGIGDSDPQPRRALLDWAFDVDALCEGLGIEHAAVLGISGGGPFALACAWRLPRRISRAVILNGLAPLDRRGATSGMAAGLRFGWWAVGHLPLQARLAAGAQARTLERRAGALQRRLTRAMSEVDRAALAEQGTGAALEAELAGAFRQGSAAVAREMRLLARPWGFDPADIRVPVDLWHGERDRTVPLAMGRWLAERIPDARLHAWPEAGHLLHAGMWPEVRSVLLSE